MQHDRPTISIILPCLNEASHIATSVETIVRALDGLSVDHELVLIDDGSTDGTWQEFERPNSWGSFPRWI